ncbi:MAG TPA: hypothetical protein VI728_04090 [Syntrophales bacterium]|nr:MAG: hypothetical protein A2052_03610 [Deltaproteobacteria bacterium GWA2_54_12]HLE17449.1 hypothetical protein [Syntrophales bacterium]
MTRIGKFIGFLLLIVFTLQVTDLACVGEDLPRSALGIQGGVQLIAADLDEGKRSYSPSGILDECQCPCHLSFTNTPSTEVSSIQTISLSLFAAADLSLKKISADIFQPPKVLI